MAEKIKILSLIPNMDFGGAQRAYNTLNNALLKEFEVIECCFNRADGYVYETKCINYDLKVPGGGGVFTKIKNFCKRVVRFRQLINKVKPDIIISHLEGADYVSLLTFTRTKKICVIHGSKYSDKKIVGLLGFFRKRLMIPSVYSIADMIVTVSKDLQQEIRTHLLNPSNRVNYIYNSVDEQAIQLLSSVRIDPSLEHIFLGKVLIGSSRLDQTQKNLRAMIDIYRQLPSREDVKLVIVGDGPDRNMLLNYAKDQGLLVAAVWDDTLSNMDAEVYFLGYQTNPFQFIKKADIFLLTSFYEGFPLGLIEAMACNTAIVAANCSTGPNEIIQGEEIDTVSSMQDKINAGALMPIPSSEESIQLWANVICELCDNQVLRQKMILNSKERLKTLNPSVIYDEWKKLIYTLVG